MCRRPIRPAPATAMETWLIRYSPGFTRRAPGHGRAPFGGGSDRRADAVVLLARHRLGTGDTEAVEAHPEGLACRPGGDGGGDRAAERGAADDQGGVAPRAGDRRGDGAPERGG